MKEISKNVALILPFEVTLNHRLSRSVFSSLCDITLYKSEEVNLNKALMTNTRAFIV